MPNASAPACAEVSRRSAPKPVVKKIANPPLIATVKNINTGNFMTSQATKPSQKLYIEEGKVTKYKIQDSSLDN